MDPKPTDSLEKIIDIALNEAQEKFNKRLTTKQKNYVKLTARGQTKSQALREAYDVSPNISARNIATRAHNELEKNQYIPTIRSYIERAIDNYRLYTSSEMHKLIAHQYQQIALGEIDASPAQLTALAQLAREHGYAIERKAVAIHHSSDKNKLKNELLERLRTIDQDDPEGK